MDLYNPKEILPLSIEPDEKEIFDVWIQQEDVIPFLEKEIEDENIIVYASFTHIFIHTVLIPNIELNSSTIQDLLGWSHNPFSSWGIACSQDDAWIEGPLYSPGSKILSKGEQIIFGRSFEGVESKKRYFELEQTALTAGFVGYARFKNNALDILRLT